MLMQHKEARWLHDYSVLQPEPGTSCSTHAGTQGERAGGQSLPAPCCSLPQSLLSLTSIAQPPTLNSNSPRSSFLFCFVFWPLIRQFCWWIVVLRGIHHVCVCVYMRACVRACVRRACVRACVCVCVQHD